VARQVLEMTDMAFWAEASLGPVSSSLRGRVARLGLGCQTAEIGQLATWLAMFRGREWPKARPAVT
jgi:hypothetical protein